VSEFFAEIATTNTIHYHLLLQRSLQNPDAYERIGVFIKTVAAVAEWNSGVKSTITMG
jgi:hypothetical protein